MELSTLIFVVFLHNTQVKLDLKRQQSKLNIHNVILDNLFVKAVARRHEPTDKNHLTKLFYAFQLVVLVFRTITSLFWFTLTALMVLFLEKKLQNPQYTILETSW